MPPNVRGHLRHALPIVFGLTALAPLTSRGAIAQTIPSYGTNAHCQRLAGFGGTFSRSVYSSCLNVEESAALALQGRWASIPASVRERCDRIASFGGSASYSILQNCVDVELAAPASPGPPAAGGTARFYLVTLEGGQKTPYTTLAECLEARAKATQTAICINRCCVEVEQPAPASSGPPAAGSLGKFYLLTSQGGQGTSYDTLAECLQARAKAALAAICINR